MLRQGFYLCIGGISDLHHTNIAAGLMEQIVLKIDLRIDFEIVIMVIIKVDKSAVGFGIANKGLDFESIP